MATATNAIATQALFSEDYAEGDRTIWDVPAGTPQRTLVQEGDLFGVTLTLAPGGNPAPLSRTYGDYTVSRERQPGVSNEKATAISDTATGVTTKGTWVFEDVDGATVDTAQGTEVYVDASGDLTLTDTDATLVGRVNYNASFVKVAGTLPVKIGA